MSVVEALARETRLRLWLALAAGALVHLAAFAAGARPTPVAWLAAGVLAALQALLVVLGPGAAALALALTVVQSLLAASAVRGPLAPALLLLALTVVLFARRAQAEEQAEVERARRLPVAGAWTPRRRASAGLALLAAGMLLLAAPLLGVLATGALELLAGRDEPSGDASSLGREPERARGVPAPATSSTPGEGFEKRFPATLEWATARQIEDDTPLVVARPLAPGDGAWRALEPLYLRGRVLERFTPTGMAAEPAPEPLTLDERRDGAGWSAWLVFEGETADGETVAGETVEFALEQLPFRTGSDGRSPLFVPAPLLALDCPGARATRAGAVRAPAPEAGPLRFRARTVEGRGERLTLPDDAAHDAPPATLALPPVSPELEALRALAAEVTRGAASDRERVARVLAYFRSEFRHEPEPDGRAGLAGLTRFLERRAGGCAHFAASATLMLRTLGVPARVATGFLARLPRPEAEAFVATPRGAHAWVEVRFEGLDWVICDPTPAPAGRADELVASAGTRRAWSAGVDLFTGFLDGEALPWRRLRGAWDETRVRLGTKAWVLVLVPLVALAGLRARRRARIRRQAPDGAGAAGESALERFTQALESAGLPRPPAHTLREHVQTLARRSDGLAPLADAAEALYRARFGGTPWSPADEAVLARALATLTGARAY